MCGIEGSEGALGVTATHSETTPISHYCYEYKHRTSPLTVKPALLPCWSLLARLVCVLNIVLEIWGRCMGNLQFYSSVLSVCAPACVCESDPGHQRHKKVISCSPINL